MTTKSIGKVRPTPKGAYNASTQYTILDIVTYNGSSYIALGNTLGNLPTNTTYWQLLVGSSNASNINVADTENNFTSTNVEDALKEVFTFANDGKTLVANAVTNKGVSASPSDTFSSLATKIGQIQGGATSTDPYLSDRLLVWEDDFSEHNLNLANWSIANKPDNLDTLQSYTTRTENVKVENSNLVITAIKENIQGLNASGINSNFTWSSGRIYSQGLQEFQYGRIEAKMKFPKLQGMWPAFWLMGANLGGVSWPSCGEIDIMEHVSMDNTTSSVSHWGDVSNNHVAGTSFSSQSLDFTQYHVYAIEWTSTQIQYLVDNVVIGTFTLSSADVVGNNAFKKPFHLILNLAVGGAWAGSPDNGTTTSQLFVDWVRVYAPVGITELFPVTSINLNSTSINLNVGEKYVLNALFTPSDACDKTLNWSSSNTSVATVNRGKVTALQIGTATIVAITKNGKIATCTINVTSNVDTTAPAVPTGLTQGTVTNNSINISWAANSESDLAGYNVYLNNVKQNTSLLTGRTYNFTNLTFSTSYTVGVSAVDLSGNESIKTSMSITTATPYVLDRFDRANNASTLGATETGQTYAYWPSNQSVTWGISNNKAYNVSGTGTSGMAVVESGQSNVSVSADITFATNEGLVFRFVDETNFLGVRIASTGLSLYKNVANTITSFGVYNFTANVGQVYNLKAVTSGTSIKIYLDSVLVIDITETTHQLATKVGIRQANGNVSYGYFDNFTVL